MNILGATYSIEKKSNAEDSYLESNGVLGYCDQMEKKIVLLDFEKDEDYKDESEEYRNRLYKESLRHEIIHAFLNESGLSNNSLRYNHAWAKNEEMVDWIAIQFPKILKVFQEVDCL